MYIYNGKNVEAWKEKTLLSKYKEECPLLYDSVTDFMCIVDSNFVIRGISPSVEQISGHKSEKLTGKRILDKLWKYGNWIGDLVAKTQLPYTCLIQKRADTVGMEKVIDAGSDGFFCLPVKELCIRLHRRCHHFLFLRVEQIIYRNENICETPHRSLKRRGNDRKPPNRIRDKYPCGR